MAWGLGGLKSCDALLERVRKNDPTLESMVILPMKTFGATELERLAEILASGKNTVLKSISASGHEVSPESLKIFGAALASEGGRNVCHISIGDDSMEDEGVEALCLEWVATRGGSLEHVDFGFKNLSSKACTCIGRVFGSSDCMKKLELYRNLPIGNKGIEALTLSANESDKMPFRSLELLDISECDIGPEGMRSLADCLVLASKHRPNPIDLIASLNPLTPAASSSLGNLIFTNTLSRLSLKSCSLGDAGILSLFECFKTDSLKSISFLDLSQNNISAVGAQGLASTIKSRKDTLPNLSEINLSGNEMGGDGIVALADALQGPGGNSTINVLDLGSTNCEIEGAIAVLHCPSLISLRLFDNNLGSQGFVALSLHLKGGHSTLEHLDLGGNRASEEAVVGLLGSLLTRNEPDENVLNTLELGGNQGGDGVERIIEGLKSVRPYLDVARDKPSAKETNNGFQNNMSSNWLKNQ
jgi:Ran GTPase-activating protein (RanGAP) involved in mRNA processing and transport